jgi:hypothetical protein
MPPEALARTVLDGCFGACVVTQADRSHGAGRWRGFAVAHVLLRVFFEPEIRAFQGNAPLRRVFWVYGVATSLGIALLYRLAVEAGRIAVQQGLLLLLALYTAWVLVAVWRCAEHAPPFWRMLARNLTVAWAVNVALIAGFLQIDLLLRFWSGP